MIVAIDTASGTVHRLAGEEGFSYSILDIKNGWLLATVQSPCTPAKLMLGALTSQGSQIAVDWTPLPAPPLPIEAQQILSSFTSTTRAYDDFVEAIILKPKSQDRRISLLSNFSRAPLVSTPHGGPNSAYATDFMLYPACLAALGFGVACINFTGSIGFGQKSIDDLIGKCGELDVHDTHLCTARAIEEEGFDPEAVFLTGGSHGGFISGHMIAKHPDLFRATVMRNPVINMGAMVLTSDIPSWSFEESGLPYDFDKPAVLTPTLYDQLYKSSPIAGIDAVQTPVLLMLGDIDRRVPPQDGLNYLHYLRSRGKEAHCLWFPDNGHPLDGMDAEARGFEAMATFFLSHLPAK